MSLENVQLNLINSVDDAFEFMRWLSTVRGPLAIDTESEGLSVETDNVRLVQFGDDMQGWAMDFSKWGGVVEDVIRKWEGSYVAHNTTFDYAMLKKHGYELPKHKCHDTRLMIHTLDPVNPTGLKQVAARIVDRTAAGLSNMLDVALGKHGGWTWADVPIVTEGPLAVYWQYGGLDCVLTRRVFDEIAPKVRTECPEAYKIELAVNWVVEKMQRRGCVIDRPFVAEKQQQFAEYVDKIERWCLEHYNVKPGSNAKVIEVLETFGFEFTKKTKTGAKVLDREVLSAIEHPLAEAVFNRRRVQKLESTYLRRFLEYSEYDGLLHPSINSIGGSGKNIGESGGTSAIRTGRMSLSNPNLQQLPRTGSFRPADVVRSAIIAREGHTLLLSDFDQVEFRIMAHLSKDYNLINTFNETADIFTDLGKMIYRDEDFTKKDPRRTTVKNATYSKLYGAGVEKLAWTAKISLEEAQYVTHRYDELYPGISKYMYNRTNEGRKNLQNEGIPYVRSPLTGRRLIADEGKEYTLTNYTIQGMAAEIMKTKIIQLDAAGLGDYMILPVHDEVIFDVPVQERQNAIQTIKSIMNDDQMLSVPLTAGIAEGARWGEKVELDV